MKRGIVFAIVAILLCTAFAGCSTPANNNAAAAKDKAILVVSFGTSYNDSRNITIGGIESAIRENFPEYEVRRAFTAQIIIDKLKERDGIKIDNVTDALDRLVADGFKTLVVQPTHLMHGYEYDDLMKELEKYKEKFKSVSVGEPLLASDDDMAAVIKAITTRTAAHVDDKTAVVFMGHGTEHKANAVYANMQEKITAAGHSQYFIGTVEATPSLDDVIAKVKAGGFTRVVLEPLMVVAGDHANNDMAGDEEDSWKSAFKAAGIEVDFILEGLGQFNEIQDIYVRHVENAIKGETGGQETAKAAPITGDQVKDGTYPIEVSSNSSMFKIVDAQLTVKEGKMSAVITLSGTGYSKLYMGTGEEALKNTDDKCIHFVEKDGKYAYEVPVEALDKDINCAAWSINKEMWYDRVLVFQSASMPKDAIVAK